MLADDYFEFRSRVGTTLFGLGRLAESLGVVPSPASTVNGLVAGLKDPYLFVVVGEVNAGKSMLLNALFGAEFCKTDALPSTDRVCYFRHGFSHQETEMSPVLREVRLPLSFLHDFHLVDTPGINSLAEGHQVITEEFLPRADAALFVFPATNPWGAQAWEFVARLHTDLRKKIILVLQQIDLRTDAEIAAIVEHINFWTQRKFGEVLPVFPVSARKALLARTSGVDKARLTAESRIASLEAHLTRIVASSKPRLEKLRNSVRMGQIFLQQANARLVERSGRLAQTHDALVSIIHAIAEQEKRTRLRATSRQDEIRQEFQQMAANTVSKLKESLTFSSLFRGASTERSLTSRLTEELTQSLANCIRTQTAQVLAQTEEDLHHLWQRSRPVMDKAMGSKARTRSMESAEPPATDWAQWPVGIPDAAAVSQSALAQRRRRFRWIVLSSLLASIAAGILLPGPVLLRVAVGLGLVAMGLFLAWWLSQRDGRSAVALLADQLGHCEEDFGKQLQERLYGAVRSRYLHFAQRFRPLQDLCDRERKMHEPHLQEAESLKKNLQELQKILGP